MMKKRDDFWLNLGTLSDVCFDVVKCKKQMAGFFFFLSEKNIIYVLYVKQLVLFNSLEHKR